MAIRQGRKAGVRRCVCSKYMVKAGRLVGGGRYNVGMAGGRQEGNCRKKGVATKCRRSGVGMHTAKPNGAKELCKREHTHTTR